ITEDGGRFRDLGEEDVHGPDRIAFSVAELYKEHFAADELVHLSTVQGPVVTASVFGPDVSLFFQLAGHFNKGRVIWTHDVFDRHGEAVAVEDFAGFADSSQVEASTGAFVLVFNPFAQSAHVFLKEFARENFAAEQPVANDDGVRAEIFLPEHGEEDR